MLSQETNLCGIYRSFLQITLRMSTFEFLSYKSLLLVIYLIANYYCFVNSVKRQIYLRDLSHNGAVPLIACFEIVSNFQ